MKFKKLITCTFCIITIALACSASAQVKKKAVVKKKPVATAAKPVPKPPFATAQEIEEGKGLITKSDCLACHKVDEKLVGPPYTAVAEKYPQNQESVNELSKKIVSGGSGVWGPVPMAPHPAITPEDADKMIKYILTLNTKSTAASTK